MTDTSPTRVVIVGQGYVGLPVVVAWDDVNETVTIPRFVPDESRS